MGDKTVFQELSQGKRNDSELETENPQHGPTFLVLVFRGADQQKAVGKLSGGRTQPSLNPAKMVMNGWKLIIIRRTDK